jgi:hypothetical protein
MPEMDRNRRAALSVAVALLLIFAAVQWRMRGPAPKPADAPGNEFSAMRALEAERATIGGKTPHPVATPENNAVRDRIRARFETLGYETQLQRAFTCNAHNVCATVENIIARAPGQPNAPSVLMCAHYDSAVVSPGASDDGTGVAAMLEIARAIRGERFRNPVTFLIDDGEELGLLGAEAYVANPMFPVAAVINVEARGTSGPSVMFETSPNNARLIPIVAKGLPRPVTTSIFFSIYELLPNDTDLTVFKRAHFTGINFGYVRNVVFYHSPMDDIDHVDLRSLQHHGDNALGSLRALGNAALNRTSTGNAVWFDILGFFVVSWPSSWTLMLAISVLLLAIIGALRLVRSRRATWGGIAIGIAAFLISVIGAALAAYIATRLSYARAGGERWLASPNGVIAASWIAGIVVTLLVTAFARRRASFESILVAYAIAWGALTLLVTFKLNGASYGFFLPALALSIGAFVRGHEVKIAVIAAVIAAIVWFPLAAQLYDALGSISLMVVAVLLALITTTFAPLFERVSRSALAVAVVAFIACIGVTAALPAYTSEFPRRITVSYLNDDTSSRWIASDASDEMRAAAKFGSQREAMFPWYASPPRYFTAPAPQLASPGVLITREGNSIRVRSQRNADRVALVIHARPAAIRINGIVPPPRSARFHSPLAPDWTRVVIRGSEMVVDVGSATPVEVYASDYTFGPPPVGHALAAARNASRAQTSDDGDMTITLRHNTL